jgi:hypothetical protein
MTKQEAEVLTKQHGTKAAAARAAGIPVSTFKRVFDGGGMREHNSESPTKTLQDFRKEHDQTWKIRDGLRRLFSGQVIMTDAEFRDAVGGNPSRWRSAADQSEFKPNRYRVSGELLWASKETIIEMRKIRGEAL